jgi:hypothetical protein
MKTKFYITASALSLILFASCSNNNKANEGQNEHVEPQTLVQTPVEKEYEHVIPYDAIESMVNSYETERIAIINNNTQLRSKNGENFSDSKNGWVSLDELSAFIEEVRAASKSKGIATKDVGMRLYFSVYPQQQSNESTYFKTLETEYRNKQTILMLPTYYDSETKSHNDILSKNSSNKSIDIFTTGSKAGAARNEGEGAAAAGAAPASQASCIALNHIGLCPPACPN